MGSSNGVSSIRHLARGFLRFFNYRIAGVLVRAGKTGCFSGLAYHARGMVAAVMCIGYGEAATVATIGFLAGRIHPLVLAS